MANSIISSDNNALSNPLQITQSGESNITNIHTSMLDLVTSFGKPTSSSSESANQENPITQNTLTFNANIYTANFKWNSNIASSKGYYDEDPLVSSDLSTLYTINGGTLPISEISVAGSNCVFLEPLGYHGPVNDKAQRTVQVTFSYKGQSIGSSFDAAPIGVVQDALDYGSPVAYCNWSSDSSWITVPDTTYYDNLKDEWESSVGFKISPNRPSSTMGSITGTVGLLGDTEIVKHNNGTGIGSGSILNNYTNYSNAMPSDVSYTRRIVFTYTITPADNSSAMTSAREGTITYDLYTFNTTNDKHVSGSMIVNQVGGSGKTPDPSFSYNIGKLVNDDDLIDTYDVSDNGNIIATLTENTTGSRGVVSVKEWSLGKKSLLLGNVDIKGGTVIVQFSTNGSITGATAGSSRSASLYYGVDVKDGAENITTNYKNFWGISQQPYKYKDAQCKITLGTESDVTLSPSSFIIDKDHTIQAITVTIPSIYSGTEGSITTTGGLLNMFTGYSSWTADGTGDSVDFTNSGLTFQNSVDNYVESRTISIYQDGLALWSPTKDNGIELAPYYNQTPVTSPSVSIVQNGQKASTTGVTTGKVKVSRASTSWLSVNHAAEIEMVINSTHSNKLNVTAEANVSAIKTIDITSFSSNIINIAWTSEGKSGNRTGKIYVTGSDNIGDSMISPSTFTVTQPYARQSCTITASGSNPEGTLTSQYAFIDASDINSGSGHITWTATANKGGVSGTIGSISDVTFATGSSVNATGTSSVADDTRVVTTGEAKKNTVTLTTTLSPSSPTPTVTGSTTIQLAIPGESGSLSTSWSIAPSSNKSIFEIVSSTHAAAIIKLTGSNPNASASSSGSTKGKLTDISYSDHMSSSTLTITGNCSETPTSFTNTSSVDDWRQTLTCVANGTTKTATITLKGSSTSSTVYPTCKATITATISGFSTTSFTNCGNGVYANCTAAPSVGVRFTGNTQYNNTITATWTVKIYYVSSSGETLSDTVTCLTGGTVSVNTGIDNWANGVTSIKFVATPPSSGSTKVTVGSVQFDMSSNSGTSTQTHAVTVTAQGISPTSSPVTKSISISSDSTGGSETCTATYPQALNGSTSHSITVKVVNTPMSGYTWTAHNA